MRPSILISRICNQASNYSRKFANSGLIILIALILLFTAIDGVRAGWSGWMPGSMSRHRDAVAVAITAVAYGHWEGYASFRSVNRTLREHGLSVQEEDLGRIGVKHYFETMTDQKRFAMALEAASTLEAPASEGMYYSQDEKGMAAFYTIAFSIFGIAPESWYWLYISLYSISVLIACLAFCRHTEILLFYLAVVCTHGIVAHVLPTIPPQDINVIFGNRFVGIMASVAAFHLMLLILMRIRPSFWQLAGAIFQTAIIYLTINARTSAAWLLIAVILMWVGLWIFWLFHKTQAASKTIRPCTWPIAIIAIGYCSLIVNQQLIQDSAFRDGRAYGGHVFWHNLATALHNNPLRTERYGIPASYPVYDDQVAFVLFDRELTANGDKLEKYINGNEDWIYRTNDLNRDFRWAAYDQVVGKVFWRTIKEDPGYAAYSFFVQQPLSAISVTWSSAFFRSRELLYGTPIFVLISGVLLFAFGRKYQLPGITWMLTAATLGASLPVLAAAAVELRVVELFYMLLLILVFGVAVLTVNFLHYVTSKVGHGEQS
jgi:hypothetical protein